AEAELLRAVQVFAGNLPVQLGVQAPVTAEVLQTHDGRRPAVKAAGGLAGLTVDKLVQITVEGQVTVGVGQRVAGKATPGKAVAGVAADCHGEQLGRFGGGAAELLNLVLQIFAVVLQLYIQVLLAGTNQ